MQRLAATIPAVTALAIVLVMTMGSSNTSRADGAAPTTPSVASDAGVAPADDTGVAPADDTGVAPADDAPPGPMAVVGGTVITMGPQGVISDGVIIVEDGTITAVGPANEVTIPSGTVTYDAKGTFVIPGLVDGHIHFFQSGGLYTRPDGFDLREVVPYEEEIATIKAKLPETFSRYLASGVTTVVDMGGPMWNFDVEASAANPSTTPNVFVAGPLIASYEPAALESSDKAIIKVTSKDEALALVDEQIAAGADLIKIWYIASKKAALSVDEFFPIVQAVAEKTHEAGLPLYVHATELATAKKAIEAGADVLVHAVTDVPVDDEFLIMAKDKGVIVIPTIWVFQSYATVYSEQFVPTVAEHLLGDPVTIATLYDIWEIPDEDLPERQKKLQSPKAPITTKQLLLDNVKAMYDAGITLAAGTDAGNVGVIHGPALYRDLELMVKAGMPTEAVLKSATVNGAKLVGKEQSMGSLEVGKVGDMVVLGADPLADITAVEQVEVVVKGGAVYDPTDLVPLEPSDLAQIQLNAYNAHDLEGFLLAYADDVAVYEYPDKLLFQGKEAMAERYGELFSKAPELHCKLVSRSAQGDVVVDQEHVTGMPGKDGPVEALAIYEIEDGLIKTVRFVK